VAMVAGGRHTRWSSGNGQRRLLRQHEATGVDVLRMREENCDVSSGTTQLSWEAEGNSLTREGEEAAPSSAISTATTSLSLTTQGNDLHGREKEPVSCGGGRRGETTVAQRSYDVRGRRRSGRADSGRRCDAGLAGATTTAGSGTAARRWALVLWQ
jgi:hypothetical protein